MSKSNLRKITHTAVIIAVVLALRNFSFLVPFAGAGGMRIDISVFFSKLPALLFGPLFGGIADGIIDFLAYIIKPEGAYLFPLTLTAILGGIIAGFLWKSIKGINIAVFRKTFITQFIKVLIVLMISNITVTTINTLILMYFFPSLAKLGFIVYYLPRLIQEIISTVLQSFVISFLLKIYSRIS